MRISISVRAFVATVVLLALAIGIYCLVDWLVVTDVERIEDMLGSASKAVGRHDIDYIVDECLAPDFKLGRLDREGIRSWGEQVLTRFDIVSVKPYSTDVKIDGSSAKATLRTFVEGGRVSGDQRLDWDVELRKASEERWEILNVRVFHFIGLEKRELPLEDVMRYASSLQN